MRRALVVAVGVDCRAAAVTMCAASVLGDGQGGAAAAAGLVNIQSGGRAVPASRAMALSQCAACGPACECSMVRAGVEEEATRQFRENG